jgi:hypothetical protein
VLGNYQGEQADDGENGGADTERQHVTVGDVENLGGWLTTVVARVCLNVLRPVLVNGSAGVIVTPGGQADLGRRG